MEIEAWVPIKGFEGQYEISSFGRIKTLPHVSYYSILGKAVYAKFKISSYRVKKGNYCTTRLTKNSVHYNVNISILVANTFIPNPENKLTVNHKDGDKNNNRASNLEWNTHKENNDHAKLTGLNKQIGETHHWAVLTEGQVLEIVKSNGRLDDIGEKYGVSDVAIGAIKRGVAWSHITGITPRPAKKKLNSNAVIDIYTSSEMYKLLAERHNVTIAAIWYIKSGASYRAITKNLKKGQYL